MFRFVKQIFVSSTAFLSCNVYFSLVMSKTNEIRHIKWHETCKYKCRSGASVCNNKQRCNNDKCRCECKELIDKGICDKGLLGILLIAIVNVINHVIKENIWIIKIVSVETN